MRGDQLIAGTSTSCPGAPEGTYRMAGDLIGCWFTDEFNVVQENPGGGFEASGTEHFQGCLDTNHNGSCGVGEPSGRFDTTFTFTAKFAPSGDEIHGRCHHPIIGGTGAFTGASGELSFKDIPSEGGLFPVSRASELLDAHEQGPGRCHLALAPFTPRASPPRHRLVGKGHADVLNIGGHVVGKGVFEPGVECANSAVGRSAAMTTGHYRGRQAALSTRDVASTEACSARRANVRFRRVGRRTFSSESPRF